MPEHFAVPTGWVASEVSETPVEFVRLDWTPEGFGVAAVDGLAGETAATEQRV